MNLLKFLFGWEGTKQVEPTWYPPTPEVESGPELVEQTMPLDIKQLFNEKVQAEKDSLARKEREFFTDAKLKVLISNTIAYMVKKSLDAGAKDDLISYMDIGDGLTEDLMHTFYVMAHKEFLALGISLLWSGSKFIGYKQSEVIEAMKKVPFNIDPNIDPSRLPYR